MQGKRRRTAGHQRRHRQSRVYELVAQRQDRSQRVLTRACADGQIGVVDVAVVRVQPGGVQARRPDDPPVQLQRARARRDAGPVHPAIEIEEEIQREAGPDRRARQRADRALVIDERREPGLRKRARELDEPRHVWAHRLVGQQHIGGPTRRHHFRFGNRGALEFGDALVHLHPDDLGQLGRLHVRAKTRDAARQADHPADVVLDAIGIDEQRRRRDLVSVADAVPFLHFFLAASDLT